MKQCEDTKMVSEWKVRVIFFPFNFQMLFTKVMRQCIHLCMCACIYTLTVQRWENKRRPAVFKNTLRREWHRRLSLLSHQHLWGPGVRALMCFNKWQSLHLSAESHFKRPQRSSERGVSYILSVFFLFFFWLFSIHILCLRKTVTCT